MERKLSICIANYNNGHYLKRCVTHFIDSHKKSKGLVDFEIIIVDDASSDNSEIIAQNLIKKYHDFKIRYIQHKFNASSLNVRKTGYHYANYDYIHFFDADDYVYENYFSVIEKQTFNFDIITFDVMHNKEVLRLNRLENAPVAFEFVWNKIINKRLLNNFTAFRLNLHDDTYINMKYLINNANLDKCYHIEDILVHYWINPKSITNSSVRQKYQQNNSMFRKLWAIIEPIDQISVDKIDFISAQLNKFIYFANIEEKFSKSEYDKIFASNPVYQKMQLSAYKHTMRRYAYKGYKFIKYNYLNK